MGAEDAAVARASATRDEAWRALAARELTGELLTDEDYAPAYSALWAVAQAISHWHDIRAQCIAKS